MLATVSNKHHLASLQHICNFDAVYGWSDLLNQSVIDLVMVDYWYCQKTAKNETFKYWLTFYIVCIYWTVVQCM